MITNKQINEKSQFEKAKREAEEIIVKPAELRAGIIIAETPDRKIKYAAFGEMGNLVELILDIFLRMPPPVVKHTIRILEENKNEFERKGLETQAPTHNRSYN